MLPERCVLFFVNEPDAARRLLVEISDPLVGAAVEWTKRQAQSLQTTVAAFEQDPAGVGPGELALRDGPPANRVTDELRQ